MDRHSEVSASDASAASVPAPASNQPTAVRQRLSCRVVYLQATSEGPESVVDHCQLEAEGSVRVYQTTSW